MSLYHAMKSLPARESDGMYGVTLTALQYLSQQLCQAMLFCRSPQTARFLLCLFNSGMSCLICVNHLHLLAAVYNAGLVHADLKTENVLLVDPGSSLMQERPRVMPLQSALVELQFICRVPYA